MASRPSLAIGAAVLLILVAVLSFQSAGAQTQTDSCGFAREQKAFLALTNPSTSAERTLVTRLNALTDDVLARPECQQTTTTTQPSTTTTTQPSTTTTTAPATTTTTAPVPPGAFPTESTTGVPAGWTPTQTLTDQDLTITTAGTVVQDLLMVRGNIWVRAENVTIRRVEMRGGRINNTCCIAQPYDGRFAGRSMPGMIVEDVTFTNPPGVAHTDDIYYRLGDSNYTARRIKILDQLEGFRTGAGDLPGAGPVDIEDSYVRIDTTTIANPGCGGHPDGVQGYVGFHTVIHHNTIHFPPPGACENSTVFIADSSDGADVLGNLLIGGGFTLQLNDGPFRFSDNVIADGEWNYGPLHCGGGVNFSIISQGNNRVAPVSASYQVGSTVRLVSC
jgi:hypothetical protein